MNDKLLHGESFSKEKFASPSKEFGIMPFWFVNGEMEYGEMERQLGELAAKGIPGIFFHSRFGIKDYMPYLGEEWLKRYFFTAETCKKLGMQCWIYDEYNWPSGTCNQETMRDRPELTGRYLQLIVNDIPGQYFMFMEGTDSRYNDLEQSEPVFACAILDENVREHRNEYVNLMPNLAFDKVITWEAPKGPWKFCYFIERQTSWYADTLNEEATQEFLTRTHQKYADHAPGAPKDSIGGFFTDEPAMHYFEVDRNNYIIPWSAKILTFFKEYNGYDLRTRLPQLFFDIGTDYAKVRHDFWSALSKQYEKAYYGQIRAWCERNGVVFTGHLLHEEYLRKHAKTGGNLFHMLKNLHMTGVDHLYPRVGTREMPEEHVALKLASSAAHQNGSTRLICESMGGAYWDCTMERMKWIADWEYVLGVNILNPHGFHYSIEGERKRDWPPSQFYHHTWWKDYGRFNDYLKRAGFLLTGGRHVAKAAILYPINSIWANYTPQAANAESAACVADFNYMTDELLRLHYDFDYVDEDMLRKMEIKDGRIQVQGEAYELLILPPMTHIKQHTLGLLKEFHAQGGKLLGDTLLPFMALEPEAGPGIEVIRDLFGVDPAATHQRFLSGEAAECGLAPSAPGSRVLFIEGSGLAAAKGAAVLAEAVGRLVAWDIRVDNDELFSLHRVKDDVPFYFVINPTHEPITARITLRAQGIPQLYSLLDGVITPLTNYRAEEGALCFAHTFPPCGSAMFSVEPGTAPHAEAADFTVTAVADGVITGYGPAQKASAMYVDDGVRQVLHAEAPPSLPAIELGGAWDFTTEGDNALLIKHWLFALDGPEKADFYRPTYEPTEDWLEYTMGGWELQLPYDRREKKYPVDILYLAEFEAQVVPEDLKLLIDGFRCERYELWINGLRVTEQPERSELDAEIKQLCVHQYVQPGRNLIAIRMRVHKKSHGLLDFLKLVGTFSLAGTEAYALAAPRTGIAAGSWTTQGYPYFSGTGKLTQCVDLPAAYLERHVLRLAVHCGKDVLQVWINGQEAGICLWEPYTLDVTKLLRPGQNEIALAVTNTLINLLEGVEHPSGVFSARILCDNAFALKI